MTSPKAISTGVEVLRRTFPGLSTADHATLLESCKLRDYPAGAVLCREGQVEDVFYIIVSGQVEVSQIVDLTERRALKTLSAPGYFGEMALIQSVPRSATVTTLEATTVLEIDQPSFDAVLRRSPVMAMARLREVIGRLQFNDEKTIANLRQKNEKLAAAYDELRRQEQLRSEFLTTVSHELRTPLTSAKGFLQLMRSGMMDDAALKAALATVGDNVEVIIALVNDILFLQEIEGIAPQFEPTDVAEVVKRVIEEKREQAAGA
ncbi:MAG: cyclic nucleotide-binding domain-containing protein, partial [Chloroflexota bacterium]